MTAIWHNPLLKLPDLAECTGIKYTRLLDWSKEPDFPSRIESRQVRVLYSDFLEWHDRRFGKDGTHRGKEVLDPFGTMKGGQK